jgi:hypothetical protein
MLDCILKLKAKDASGLNSYYYLDSVCMNASLLALNVTMIGE